MNGHPVKALVIGASAGGIEALGALLPRIPRDAPFAVIIVVHLPDRGPNLLPEIFGHRCALPVSEAEAWEDIAPGRIYFAPPGYHLLVEPDAKFSLSVDEPVHYSRPSIDVLFESAAQAYGPRLLGIVLSGANSDGAEGLATIELLGGRAWVQAPTTAQNPEMPAAALACARNAESLTLAEMADRLATL